MQTRRLKDDERAADKVIVIALVALLTISVISGLAYMSLDGDADENGGSQTAQWIDSGWKLRMKITVPGNLMAHRLQTENMLLIDYHNLNCDGNIAPPLVDNVAGRPCYPEYKNVGPTPGDSSEISIEGNPLLEDCVKHPDGTGGCYAYVSSYNQFEILDISEPNNIVLLFRTYSR